MSALERQKQIQLNIGKTFINAIGVDSAMFENEAHFGKLPATVGACVQSRTHLPASMLVIELGA
jgi:hypothetical protein